MLRAARTTSDSTVYIVKYNKYELVNGISYIRGVWTGNGYNVSTRGAGLYFPVFFFRRPEGKKKAGLDSSQEPQKRPRILNKKKKRPAVFPFEMAWSWPNELAASGPESLLAAAFG